MAEKVFFQESKEFQLKIDIGQCFGKGPEMPAPTDKAIFEAVAQAIRQAVFSLDDGKKSKVTLNNNSWRREGIRYDAADRRLKANNLTLAIEATDKCTKLKCKEHNFIPELLFVKPGQSVVLPDIRAAAAYKKHDTTLKLEQDIHLDNIKYCGSGSLYVKGRQTAGKDSLFFSCFFPGLTAFFPAAVALREVSHWDETVFDDMSTCWGRNKIDSWMLVNRRDAGTKEFLESELSFKIVKKLDEAWDRSTLRDAGRLYLALRKTGLFQELPPIFTYDNPVSSIDIVEAPEKAMA